MIILLAILALGSEGTATHRIVVEPSIEQIVWQVAAGGMQDVWTNFERRNTRDRAIASDWTYPSLRIDGRERTGIIAWAAAAYRVVSYAMREDARAMVRDRGSVEYFYRLRLRGLDIRRTTRIEDGRVSIVTDVYGSIGPKGELYRVTLVLRAVETGAAGTTITGSATGYSHIGDCCRLVRRIAEPRISAAMRDALRTIDAGGRGLYASGDINKIMTNFIERLR